MYRETVSQLCISETSACGRCAGGHVQFYVCNNGPIYMDKSCQASSAYGKEEQGSAMWSFI